MRITKDENGNIKSIHIHKDEKNLASEINKLDIKQLDKQDLLSKVAKYEQRLEKIKLKSKKK